MKTKIGPTATLQRQWAMLRAIPRHPQAITVTRIVERLRGDGFNVGRRQIERDLHDAVPRFPLQIDTRSRPYGWSWMKDAGFDFMPRLSAYECVALKLAQEHVRHMLPQSMQRELAPLFAAADRELVHTGWKQWHHRTAYAPPMLVLRPPPLDAKVLANVQQAVAHRVVFTARYRSKGNAVAKEMLIHPLGLLVRGPVQYLVCTVRDYGKVIQLAVHRIGAVHLGTQACFEPPGFDFKAYAAGSLAIASRGPIRVQLRFETLAGEHLGETALSEDQSWIPDPASDTIDVQATVEDDRQLMWWLLGFGGKVEVLGPAHLRDEVAGELERAVGNYRRGAASA